MPRAYNNIIKYNSVPFIFLFFRFERAPLSIRAKNAFIMRFHVWVVTSHPSDCREGLSAYSMIPTVVNWIISICATGSQTLLCLLNNDRFFFYCIGFTLDFDF